MDVFRSLSATMDKAESAANYTGSPSTTCSALLAGSQSSALHFQFFLEFFCPAKGLPHRRFRLCFWVHSFQKAARIKLNRTTRAQRSLLIVECETL
jgi:hypothetical protein